MKGAPLTILVHGDAGVGKSWLGASAPAPRLILDAEGRARYAPSVYPKIFWDPAREAPPAAPTEDAPWDTCIVAVSRFDTINLVYQWLQSRRHPFKSVSLDSLMEMQKRFIDSLVGMAQIETGQWGDILRHLEKLVRDYRDLVLDQENSIEVVCVIVGSDVDDKTGKYRPLLQGSLRKTVPYYMDAVGYMYVTHEQGGATRLLQLQPSMNIVAKDGTHALTAAYGPVITNPDLTQMHEVLNR